MEGYGYMGKVSVIGLTRLREISTHEKNGIICRSPQYLMFESIDKHQYQVIAPDDVDFSKITVVLGKDGGISCEIVDDIAMRLRELKVNTFVSDINNLTPTVSEQAILENRSSTILIIKMDGQSARNINSSIIVGCETTKYDGLGLTLASGIGLDKTTVEKGKMISGINIPTELENMFSKRDFDNIVSIVTVLPANDVNPEELANNITDGIVKFTLFRDVEKNRQYYDFKTKQNNWKFFSDSKTGTATNPVIYPDICHAEILKTNTKSM